MTDYINVILVLAVAAGIVLCIRSFARKKRTSAEEFERNVSRGPTLGRAGVNALDELINPAAARSREFRREFKEAPFERRRAGKGNQDDDDSILDADTLE